MSGAAYFSEAVDTPPAISAGKGPVIPAPAASPATKAAAGQNPSRSPASDSATSGTPGFAQVLRKGLAKGAPEKSQTNNPVDPGVQTPGAAAPAPSATTDLPDLAAALAALLGAGQAPVVVASVADASQQEQAAPNAGEEKTAAAPAGARETLALRPSALDTPPRSGPRVQVATDPEEQSAASPAPAAAAGSTPEDGLAARAKDAPGPGAKLKLDFSVFDAAFPEGWQALFTPEQNPGAAGKTAQAAGKPSGGAQVEILPVAAEPSAGAGERTAPGGEKTESAGSAQNQLALDLQALAVAATAKNPGVAAPVANPAPAALVPHSEKSAEPAAARVDMRTESVPEAPKGFTGAKPSATTSTASAPTPGQMLSRLTELQRQLTVEKLSQSVLPALQGGRETLTLDLNPPELGRVQVHVEKAANGGVNAVLTMQDRSVGEFFQGHIETIRKTLEDAGIQVGGLSVEIRQQFNQDAGEKSAPGAGKFQEHASAQTGRAAADARKTTAAWGGGGASRVEIMV